MRFREITSLNEFKSIKETWNDLLLKSRDGNIFLTWEWLYTWFKYFNKNNKLNILSIEEHNDIIGFIPLMSCKLTLLPLNLRILENIGRGLSDYGGIIYSTEYGDKKLFDLLDKYIQDKDNIMVFSQVPNDSLFLESLGKNTQMSLGQQKICYSPFLNVCNWEDYWNSLSKKFRKNLIRSENLVEENLGNIHLKRYTSINDLESGLNKFWDLHHKKMMNKNLPSFNKSRKLFYTEIANQFAKNGWLDLSFLEINEIPVSGVFGFFFCNKYYYYQTALDPTYHRYSLGNVHILHLLRDKLARDVPIEFDFLRGDEPYKLRWKPKIRENRYIYLKNWNLFGYYDFKLLNYQIIKLQN